MNIKDFIERNWTDCFFDISFSIEGYSNRLKSIMDANPTLAKDLKPILKSKVLSRSKVFDWVNKDHYQGFLAAMIWGGISTATTKKRTRSNAELAFSTSKELIEKTLNKVTALLKEGKETEAFDYLYNGEGQIEGIGVSYLTKILYFFSPRSKNESLIFDRWGRFMHAALLMDDESARINDFYSYKYNSDFKAELKSKKPEKELYLDYLERMRSVNKKEITSPGHLEAFLFGKKLYEKNQNNGNPRFFIYNLVKGFFTGTVPKQLEKATPLNNKIVRKDSIHEIEPGKPVMNRIPIKGWSIVLDGKEFFVLVGEDSKKSFCDVLSKDGHYPNEEVLFQKGFERRGKGKPYFVRIFKKKEIEEALDFMDETKELFLKH